MTPGPLSPVLASRLEKAAVDNGFDLELPPSGPWLRFASSQCPLRIWLGASSELGLLAALSRQNVTRALADHGAPLPAPLPSGALGGRALPDVPALHRLLRRAFQLSRTLPDELLQTFQGKTAGLPRGTEAERLVVQRVGQEIFRRGLLDLWEGRCAVTGLDVPELLRASHVKPWADCQSDAERLDVYNGLLLAPHLDAAFDRGLVTFEDDGRLRISPRLSDAARAVLGLDRPLLLRGLADEHLPYLSWHRSRVFRDLDED
jgi:putative restriction endonuclease